MAHRRTERLKTVLRRLAAGFEGVGRIPDDADAGPASQVENGPRRRARSEVAVRFDPDLDTLRSLLGEFAERVRDEATRRLEVRTRLHGIAEDADPGSTELRRQFHRAAGLVDVATPRRRLDVVEVASGVDAGDREAGVAQPLPRFRKAAAREFGPPPQHRVALEEAQLDAVIAFAAGDVEDPRQRPVGTAERREAEPHVIRSSIAALTRFFGRSPRKKRSRSSSTVSTIACRTSTGAAPTCGVTSVRDRRRSGCACGSGSTGSVTSSAQRSRPLWISRVERRQVDESAPADVDDGGALRQARERRAVDHAARAVGQARREDQELGPAQQPRQRREGDAGLRPRVGIADLELHGEGLQQARHLASDVAVADQPDAPSAQRLAVGAVQVTLAVDLVLAAAESVLVVAQPAGRVKQECDRQLGDVRAPSVRARS